MLHPMYHYADTTNHRKHKSSRWLMLGEIGLGAEVAEPTPALTDRSPRRGSTSVYKNKGYLDRLKSHRRDNSPPRRGALQGGVGPQRRLSPISLNCVYPLNCLYTESSRINHPVGVERDRTSKIQKCHPPASFCEQQPSPWLKALVEQQEWE